MRRVLIGCVAGCLMVAVGSMLGCDKEIKEARLTTPHVAPLQSPAAEPAIPS